MKDLLRLDNPDGSFKVWAKNQVAEANVSTGPTSTVTFLGNNTAELPTEAVCDFLEQPVPKPPVPAIDSLEPASALVGGADLMLHVKGTNFTASSVISFAADQQPTTFVTTNELTALVRPSTATEAMSVPVTVQTGEQTSNVVNFDFTEPESPAKAKR